MNKLQIIITGIGILCFLWFAAPLIVPGIANIGNITGMVLCALLVLYGLYMKKVHDIILMGWERKSGRIVLSVVAAAAILVILTAAVETVLMVKTACKKPPANVTAVVLGCSVIGTRPSMILQERLDAAYAYLEENKEAMCILSGGMGKGEDISEAECMYRYLTGRGIEGERLIKEDVSTTTEENLLYSKELLEEYGLGNEITIVTSEFHEYRANATAEKLGFTSYSTPSSTFFAFLPTYYVRELYGILYYMIR